MVSVKSILNKVRGIPKQEVRRSLLEDLLAQSVGEDRQAEVARSQSAIIAKREHEAFMAELEKQRKIEQAEADRQAKINETRLQNLKKARRKLKRLRSKND